MSPKIISPKPFRRTFFLTGDGRGGRGGGCGGGGEGKWFYRSHRWKEGLIDSWTCDGETTQRFPTEPPSAVGPNSWAGLHDNVPADLPSWWQKVRQSRANSSPAKAHWRPRLGDGHFCRATHPFGIVTVLFLSSMVARWHPYKCNLGCRGISPGTPVWSPHPVYSLFFFFECFLYVSCFFKINRLLSPTYIFISYRPNMCYGDYEYENKTHNWLSMLIFCLVFLFGFKDGANEWIILDGCMLLNKRPRMMYLADQNKHTNKNQTENIPSVSGLRWTRLSG